MEEKAVHTSLFKTQWKKLVGRPGHRWNILTPSFIKRDVAGGIDLVQGACKPRTNIHSQLCGKLVYLCNCLLYKKAVLWAG